MSSCGLSGNLPAKNADRQVTDAPNAPVNDGKERLLCELQRSEVATLRKALHFKSNQVKVSGNKRL